MLNQIETCYLEIPHKTEPTIANIVAIIRIMKLFFPLISLYMKLNMKATAEGPQFVIGTEIAWVRLFALKLKVMFPTAQIAPFKLKKH